MSRNSIIHKINEIHLMKRKEIDPFLKRLFTFVEKSIVYNNINRKRSWLLQMNQTSPKKKKNEHEIMTPERWQKFFENCFNNKLYKVISLSKKI